MKTTTLSLLLTFFLGVVLPPPASGMARRPKAKPTPEAEAAPSPVAEATPIPAADSQASVIVLGYHRFMDKVRRPDTEITEKEFEEQMQQLKDNGVTVISMDDFLAWRRGEKTIPERSAMITFDDGWRSQLTKAWPILKKFDYPFTLFIYTDYVKGGPKSGGESMSWQDLEAFRDAGVAIESHTISHSDLRGKRGQREAPDYEAWLANELQGSRDMLQQRLGIPVRAIAVPYGFYNPIVQFAAEKAGYEALFTVAGSVVTRETPSFAIGRYIIQHEKPAIFQAALRSLGTQSGARPEAIAELTNVALSPESKATITEERPEITASLRPFGEGLDPKTVTMRLSGRGVVEATYDEKANTLTHRPSENLPPGRYTVIVSATNNGRQSQGRWEFTIAAPEGAKATEESSTEKKPEESQETPPASDLLD